MIVGWSVLAGFLGGCASSGAGNESAESNSSTEEEKETTSNVSLGRGDEQDPEPGDGDGISADGGDGAPDRGGSEECLPFMSWGSVAVQGAVPGEAGLDAIVRWFNDSSSARGEHFAKKPEITPEFLASYELVLLQNLASWEISDAEVEVFQSWVREGGSVMALSGYDGDAAQVVVTNRLLSFTGMNYMSSSESGDTSTTLGVCGYCLGSASRQEGWNADHPIAQGISAVGAFGGRPIQGEGAIVAQEGGKFLGMTKELEGGRVFLFHDDWISYQGVWSNDAPGECSENSECANATSKSAFQVPLFWKNAFDWLVGGRECFVVEGIEPLD